MNYSLLADAVGIIHAVIVLFIVGGQALVLAGWGWGWAWTRGRVFRFAHLCAIGFVVAQQWLGAVCPLTLWESELRRKAGDGDRMGGLETGFIEYWLNALLYFSAPAWVFTAVYTAFGAPVAAPFVFYPPRGKDQD